MEKVMQGTELQTQPTFEVPSVPNAAKKNANPLYIYNIGPEEFRRNIGHMGEFLIQSCPEGKSVSEPLVIPEVLPEFYDQGTRKKGLELWDADVIAKDLVRTNDNLSTHTANLEWHGVFISSNNPPTKGEIAAAKAKRKQYLEHLVSEADGLALRGEAGLRDINIPHRKAVIELNVKRDWQRQTIAQDSCPACGGDILPGVAVCKHCTAIVDEEKARKYFPERFQEKAVEPPPVAKRN
jgi:hypothetical protein